jgi:hypothetical protein
MRLAVYHDRYEIRICVHNFRYELVGCQIGPGMPNHREAKTGHFPDVEALSIAKDENAIGADPVTHRTIMSPKRSS